MLNPFTTARPLEGGVAIVTAVKGPFAAFAVTCRDKEVDAAVAAVWLVPVGAGAAVTELDTDDAELVPTPFTAVTVKVYAVPFVSPVTVMGEVEPVAMIPPGDDVTVYPVIDSPPVKAGAVNAMVA